VSAPVPYIAGLLERIGHDGYAGPAHTQHLRHEFLGELNVIAADQVAAAQQPATETRFERVRRVAGSGLLRLCQEDLLVLDQGGSEPSALVRQPADMADVDHRCLACDLHDGAADGDVAV